MEDIFESIGTDPMKARKAARELAELDPEIVGKTRKSERSKKAKSNRAKGDRVEDKCVESLTDDGWLVTKVDYTSGGGKGAVTQHDMFGVADVFAFKDGTAKLIQVTIDTPNNQSSHERTFCEDRPDNAEKRTQRTPYANLSAWLEHGGIMEMWLYRKEKGKWVPRVVEITAEWLRDRKAGLDRRRAA